MVDVANILTTEDYSRRRTPPELAAWVSAICDEYSKSQDAKEFARLRKGLSKQFFEEARPLSLLATRLYGDCSEVWCQPILGNQAFDAVIKDCRDKSAATIYLECTCAVDGYADHLRMKVLNEKGHVSAYGHVTVEGTIHTGQRITIDGGAMSRDELRIHSESLLVKALQSKADKHYGNSHWLCVEFDDWIWLRNAEDAATIKASLADCASHLKLDFAKVFVLGSSGELLWQLK
jgi:hypothetical protein